MESLLYILLMAGGMLLIFWLRTFPFRETKTKESEHTAPAEVIARRIQSGNPHRSGRSHMGYTHLVTFRFANGTETELYAYDHEWGALREGMHGKLTWKGPYFVRFETDKEE